MRSSFVHSARRLRRSPIFTTTTVLSLGLGIGLASSAASVLEVVLKPTLPYDRPEELAEVLPTAAPGGTGAVDYGIGARLISEWTGTELRTVSGLAGEALGTRGLLDDGAGPRSVDVRPVVGDWFGLLGVEARQGRVLVPSDLVPGAAPALVATDRFWREYLSATEDVVGRTVQVSDVSYVVVGVMPPSFSRSSTAWVSTGSRAPASAYRVVARLNEGASASDASRELDRLASLLPGDDDAQGSRGAVAVPLVEAIRTADQSRLWLLVGAVATAVLIAIINLTNLFLVRAQAGRADLAVRRSLGATPTHLVRGTIEDSLIVGLVAAGLGLLLANWGKDVLFRFAASAGSSINTPALDGAAISVAVAIPLMIAAVVAAQELRDLSRSPLRSSLQSSSGGSVGTKRDRRVRNGLVALQVAATVLLLAIGTVVGVAYREYRSLDLGYDLDGVVLAVPDYGAAGMDRAGQIVFAQEVSRRLMRHSEVVDVGLVRVDIQPYPVRPEGMLRVDRGDAGIVSTDTRSAFYGVDAHYFEVLGVPLTRGRWFTEDDGPSGAQVAVVNDAAARIWWAGDNPIGRQVQLGENGEWLTVVGTVGAGYAPTAIGRLVMAQGQDQPLLFRPIRQSNRLPPGWEGAVCSDIVGGCGSVHLHVRSGPNVGAALDAVQEEMGRSQPAVSPLALESLLDAQMGALGEQARIMNRVLGAAACVGLLLALLGIAGVVSDGVVRRTKEIGLRMALGARAPQVLGTIAKEATLTALAGAALGAMGVVLLSRYLSRVRLLDLLARWELAPALLSPTVLVAALGVLTAVVLAVTAATAMRALRVPPAVALRGE